MTAREAAAFAVGVGLMHAGMFGLLWTLFGMP